MTTAGGLLSPESTVTSLLASSGHLVSTLHPESSQSIWYKDTKYESASEALDAYIADFKWTQLTSGQPRRHLKLPKTPVTSRLPRSGLRNKDGKFDMSANSCQLQLHILTKAVMSCNHFLSNIDYL